MFRAQVSSKGQVVIPKPLRDRWGIAEGTEISFTEDARGLHLSVQRDSTRTEILRSLQAGLGLAGKGRFVGGPARTPAAMRSGLRAAFKKKPA